MQLEAYRKLLVALARELIERLPDDSCHREKASKELLEGWMAPHVGEDR
jgi:hypothetical protein